MARRGCCRASSSRSGSRTPHQLSSGRRHHHHQQQQLHLRLHRPRHQWQRALQSPPSRPARRTRPHHPRSRCGPPASRGNPRPTPTQRCERSARLSSGDVERHAHRTRPSGLSAGLCVPAARRLWTTQALAPGELTPGIPAREYAMRRQLLMSALPPRSLVVVPSAGITYMSGVIPYPYRQVRRLPSPAQPHRRQSGGSGAGRPRVSVTWQANSNAVLAMDTPAGARLLLPHWAQPARRGGALLACARCEDGPPCCPCPFTSGPQSSTAPFCACGNWAPQGPLWHLAPTCSFDTSRPRRCACVCALPWRAAQASASTRSSSTGPTPR